MWENVSRIIAGVVVCDMRCADGRKPSVKADTSQKSWKYVRKSHVVARRCPPRPHTHVARRCPFMVARPHTHVIYPGAFSLSPLFIHVSFNVAMSISCCNSLPSPIGCSQRCLAYDDAYDANDAYMGRHAYDQAMMAKHWDEHRNVLACPLIDPGGLLQQFAESGWRSQRSLPMMPTMPIWGGTPMIRL